MTFTGLLERIRTRFPRVRHIPRERIGDALNISCPMLYGFHRPASDCRECEYNLGEHRRGTTAIQLCGYGLKPRRQVPAWIVKLLGWLKAIPWPKPYMSARFQWRRGRGRPLTNIQRRQHERYRRREREREQRQKARELRMKAQRARAERRG